jgi:hypothetical protein
VPKSCIPGKHAYKECDLLKKYFASTLKPQNEKKPPPHGSMVKEGKGARIGS